MAAEQIKNRSQRHHIKKIKYSFVQFKEMLLVFPFEITVNTHLNGSVTVWDKESFVTIQLKCF